MSSIDLYSVIGWFGTFLVLLAYYLLSIKKVKFNSIPYNLLNFFGAIGIGVSTFMTQSWPAFALNIAWAGIAVFFVYKKLSAKPVYKELA
ncbi:Uncharacterised protein [uncultured archaeon]|nr:Uncharacterised protein [uncultured archaeon]